MNLYESMNNGFLKKYGINESLDKPKTLIESLEELLEAMSPEDEADSAIIKGIIDKSKRRTNAKLTPEEKAIMKKYNLDRGYDGDIFVDGTETGHMYRNSSPSIVDPQNKQYGQTSWG